MISPPQVMSAPPAVSPLIQIRVRWSIEAGSSDPPRSRARTVAVAATGASPGSARLRSRVACALPANSDGIEKNGSASASGR